MSYCWLSDTYDVPFRGGDGEVWSEGSDEVFRYFICGVYPVKDASMALRYFADEKEFRSTSTGHVVAAPEIGFMFPAFDDRTANIYNALYYTKDVNDIHSEFIDAVFNVEKNRCQQERNGELLAWRFARHLKRTVVLMWFRRYTSR